jgi:hypothetical protein
MWRDNRVRDAGVAGSANEVTDGRSCCGSANSTSIGHHQRLSVGGTHRDRISETLGGRSEEISQVCVVWGKAVALSRLEPPECAVRSDRHFRPIAKLPSFRWRLPTLSEPANLFHMGPYLVPWERRRLGRAARRVADRAHFSRAVYSDCAYNLLMYLGAEPAVSSENPLKLLRIGADFDSTIRRFESSRPSQEVAQLEIVSS